MIRIAVTGGIACGKSRVASIMREAGVGVCEADAVAHALYAKGGPAFHQIVDTFGDTVLGADGGIDRRALGRIVFADPVRRLELNAMLHPQVKREVQSWMESQAASGMQTAAVVIPLLFEAGMATGWDAIICVGCSLDHQRARLRARGLDEVECAARVKAQMPLALKMGQSDYRIWNDGSPEELVGVVGGVLRQIEEKRL